MAKVFRNIQNPLLRQRARELRREQTPPEARLWRALRNRAAGGLKFRRQVPFGSYIVDFYCAEQKLVVEVDGSVQAPPGHRPPSPFSLKMGRVGWGLRYRTHRLVGEQRVEGDPRPQ